MIVWIIGERRAKSARIGGACAVFDGGRHAARVAGPEPNIDVSRSALHCEPSTTVVIEVGAIRVSVIGCYTAACITVVVGIAVCRTGSSSRKVLI